MTSIPSIASDKLLKMKFMQRGSQINASKTSSNKESPKPGAISKKATPFRGRKIIPHPGIRIDYSSSFLDFMDISPTLGRRIHTNEGMKQPTISSPVPSFSDPSPPPSKKPKLASPKRIVQSKPSFHPKTRHGAKLLAGPTPKLHHK